MARDNKKKEGEGFTFDNLFNNLTGRAGKTISRAVGQSTNLLEMLLKAPEYMEHIGKAGRYLKDLRKVAGLTREDLAKAVNLDNPDLLRAIEEGRSPITLDVLFRLASFYSRNDPFTFMVNFSREYAPWLWQILRITGIEMLLITVERELKFINIYRSRESARQLSDENFDRMLNFVSSGFDMAMDFIEPLEAQLQQQQESAARTSAAKKAEKTADAKSDAATASTESPRATRTRTATAKTGTAKPRTAPARKPTPKNAPTS